MAQAAPRRWEMDALRGLMLVLMASTHFPTRLSDPLGQPFGFVSAAEGFVLLSAYMAGLVYGGKGLKHGDAAMQGALFQRALKIYVCQAALLLFAFTVIAAIGVLAREDAITSMLGLFLDRPLVALVGSLLLVYNPSLLDILPIYIFLMLLSPVILLHGMRQRWGILLGLSGAIWLAAQFGLGRAIYDVVDGWLGMPVRYQEMGAFEIFGWQFLWVIGLWMGSTAAEERQAPDAAIASAGHVSGTAFTGAVPDRFPPWMVTIAVVVAVIGFVWRHAVGQVPFPGMPALTPLFDKWQLGPLRMINFFALLLLVIHFGPWLKRHVPRVPALETMGQQSLPVFCAHLVVALLALAIFGPSTPDRVLWIDALILVVGYGTLYAVAVSFKEVDRRAALLRQRLAQRRERQLSAAGAVKSASSTAHNPRR